MAVAMQTEDFPFLPSGLAEVNKMIKEHGDLFSDAQCKVCSAVLISESQKLTHYQSKKHANKVRRYLSLQNEKEPVFKKLKSPSSDNEDCNNGDSDRQKVCHMCNMTFSSPVMAESHYQGRIHAKNLRLKTVGLPNTTAAPQTAPPAPPKKPPADESSGVPATGSDESNPDRFCSICQASFNNPLMAQQHYVGKRHRKQMKKRKLMETYGPSTSPATTVTGYPCTICKLELNSVEQYQSHISGAKHKNQVKKAGGNPEESEKTEEEKPPLTDDYQCSGGENEYMAADDYYGKEEEQDQDQDQNQDQDQDQDQYAPEDTEYSEEYQ